MEKKNDADPFSVDLFKLEASSMKCNLHLTHWSQYFKALLTLTVLLNLFACSEMKSWQEEVKLSDGRVIEVTQKRRCEGDCIERESWLSVRLPETGEKKVTWNEKLVPMLVNVFNGKLYVVGIPPTGREYDLYGRPEPFYLCFRWESEGWKRVKIADVPIEIHDGNLVIDGGLVNIKRVDLAIKKMMNSDAGYINATELKRIEPKYRSNFSR